MMKDFFERFHAFALVGASQNPHAFSRKTYDFLASQNCTIYAVNPKLTEINGRPAFKTIEELPSVEAVLFFTNPRVSEKLLEACKNKGIENIWFQQGAADKAVLLKAQQMGFNYEDSCVFLHHPRAGFPHNFHRFINRVFKIEQ